MKPREYLAFICMESGLEKNQYNTLYQSTSSLQFSLCELTFLLLKDLPFTELIQSISQNRSIENIEDTDQSPTSIVTTGPGVHYLTNFAWLPQQELLIIYAGLKTKLLFTKKMSYRSSESLISVNTFKNCTTNHALIDIFS